MDEKIVHFAARFVEDDFEWLKRIARARGWPVARVLRECVREARMREYDRAEEEHLREIADIPDPPDDILENRISAADAFPDDLPDQN